MSKMYYDNDCNKELLNNLTVAVIGYGSQGHAHAQNLRDSGVKVVVGLYENSKSAAVAKADGFEVLNTPDAVIRLRTPRSGTQRRGAVQLLPVLFPPALRLLY